MGRARAVVALCLLVGAFAAGCSSAATSPPSVGSTWTRVSLPAGYQPSLLATYPGDGLLVAGDGSADGAQKPGLLILHGKSTSSVPVVPATYYGTRAIWRGLSTLGGAIYGFGGRSGGAHGNTRWSTWAGSSDGVREEPQLFETFGGPDAGSLGSVVQAFDGTPVIVGSRVSPSHTGLDIAIWNHVGHRWVRRTTNVAELADSARQAPAVQTATQRQYGVLISGAFTHLVGGRPRLTPAVWWSANFASTFGRTDLPAGDAGVASAQAASCYDDGSCLVVGYVGDRVAAWELSPNETATRISLPSSPGGPGGTVLPPLGEPGSYVVAVSSPAGVTTVLAQEGTHWHRQPGPRGRALGFAKIGTRWWITTSTGSTSALWSEPAQR